MRQRVSADEKKCEQFPVLDCALTLSPSRFAGSEWLHSTTAIPINSPTNLGPRRFNERLIHRNRPENGRVPRDVRTMKIPRRGPRWLPLLHGVANLCDVSQRNLLAAVFSASTSQTNRYWAGSLEYLLTGGLAIMGGGPDARTGPRHHDTLPLES